VDAQADLMFQIGGLILRPRAAGGWGEFLPFGAQFTLGGAHGFPGLRAGERRGSQVASGSLAVLHRIAGPFMIGYGVASTGRGVFKIGLGN
jgi:hypothetical protein